VPDGLPKSASDIRDRHLPDGRYWGVFTFPRADEAAQLRALAGEEITTGTLTCDPPGRSVVATSHADARHRRSNPRDGLQVHRGADRRTYASTGAGPRVLAVMSSHAGLVLYTDPACRPRGARARACAACSLHALRRSTADHCWKPMAATGASVSGCRRRYEGAIRRRSSIFFRRFEPSRHQGQVRRTSMMATATYTDFKRFETSATIKIK
jgi:hypothetical protein